MIDLEAPERSKYNAVAIVQTTLNGLIVTGFTASNIAIYSAFRHAELAAKHAVREGIRIEGI
jgi:hypothetical protein